MSTECIGSEGGKKVFKNPSRNPVISERPDGKFLVDCGRYNGKQHRYVRDSRPKALALASQVRIERERDALQRKRLDKHIGEQAKALDLEGVKEYVRIREMCKGTGMTPLQACEAGIKFGNATHPVDVPKAVDDYLAARKAETNPALSVRTIKYLVHDLGSFKREFGGMKLHEVDSAQVKRFVRQSGGYYMQRPLRNAVWGFYTWAIDLGYATVNPAMQVKLGKKPEHGEPEILSIADIEKLLDTAQSPEFRRMLPNLVLRLFCGMRPDAEASHAKWSDVKLDRKFVETWSTKTHKTRYITLYAPALAFLGSCDRGDTDKIYWSKWAWAKLRKKAGVIVPQDSLRHSFASYWIGNYHNAHKLAVLMGHTGVQTAAEFYRRSVTARDSKAFWNLRPRIEDRTPLQFPVVKSA